MTALWIAHVTVTDPEAYGEYARLAGPAIAAHGGVFLARGSRYVQLEGTENRVTVARNRYIDSVQQYNVLARSFPTNLTAMIFSYSPKAGFTVVNEAEISTPPKVDFGGAGQSPGKQ